MTLLLEQIVLEEADKLTVIAAVGWVIDKVWVAEQVPSNAVRVYTLADKPVWTVPVNEPGIQVTVYVPDPPDGVTVAAPVDAPKQTTLVVAVVVKETPPVPGVTKNVHNEIFPAWSVTVIVTWVTAVIVVPGAGLCETVNEQSSNATTSAT